MNALAPMAALRVEPADLSSAAQVAAIEAYVRAHPDSTPFHRPAWVLAVARGTGQKPHCLLAKDGVGRIAGVLPLTEIRSLLFGRALVSSGFAVDGGILADGAAAARMLGDACWTLAERLGCATAELRGGMEPAGAWIARSGTHLNFRKPLEADAEAQLLSVPKRHRAEIRKGLANDFRFETGRDRRFRDAHYALFARNVHSLGTPVFPRRLFDEVLDAFGEDVDIALVLHEGKAVSSVLSLYHRGACMPYWHGSAPQARALRSNEVLYFHLMNLARERGCTLFDFGRSKADSGHAAWKKSWGFEPEPLVYHVRSADGAPARDVNPLSPRYRRKIELWKRMPLGLANLVGPMIARGLG